MTENGNSDCTIVMDYIKMFQYKVVHKQEIKNAWHKRVKYIRLLWRRCGNIDTSFGDCSKIHHIWKDTVDNQSGIRLRYFLIKPHYSTTFSSFPLD